MKTHKHWFPVLLLALFLLGAGSVAAQVEPQPAAPSEPQPAAPAEPQPAAPAEPGAVTQPQETPEPESAGGVTEVVDQGRRIWTDVLLPMFQRLAAGTTATSCRVTWMA